MLPPIMQSPKVLLFDFDGTIADTLTVSVGIFNAMSEEFSYRPIPEEEIPAARKMGVREIIATYGISLLSVPKIAHRGLKLLHARMDDINPFVGIPEVLHQLKARGYILGILTSNSEENVSLFLRRHQLEIFDFISSSSRLLGKARVIRQILKKNRWSKKEVIFLGDECRDIEAAHKTGIGMVAVPWGFNSRDALCAFHPEQIVETPAEILHLFPPCH